VTPAAGAAELAVGKGHRADHEDDQHPGHDALIVQYPLEKPGTGPRPAQGGYPQKSPRRFGQTVVSAHFLRLATRLRGVRQVLSWTPGSRLC